jgi:hypothetical protein
MPDSPQPQECKYQWFKDLIDKHYDKLLIMTGFAFCIGMAKRGYNHGQTDFASATIDLAKQFGAAFLTLVASAGLTNRKSNNGGNRNGTTTEQVTVTPTLTVNPGAGGMPAGK